MDHHKMAQKAESKPEGKDADAGLVQATGKVNAVDAAQHTVNITHAPIKALGWPKMKMEFTVDKAVGLTDVKPGDAVSFTLKPQGDDDYIITALTKTP
jgi:Cu/Ag efflux protein CusF